MFLHSYRLKNYRRLRDVHIELSSDISIFVGANNSGKTSATQAIQMFLSKEHFSLFDFSSHAWKILNAIGEAEQVNDSQAAIPSISLDLWFDVSESDLYLVIPILPSSDWAGTKVGIRIEFAATNTQGLLQRFREKLQTGRNRVSVLPGGAGSYVPWPKNLTGYLEKELHREFEFKYFVLDRTQFNEEYEQNIGYEPVSIGDDQGGAAFLKSLINVDSLRAQRHLADPSFQSSGGTGRAEDLSRRLSRFYKRNLEQRGEDHSALKALFESEAGLDTHLMEVFEPTLNRIATLGYPGMSNPKLEIKSGLNPATVMSQEARVHYVLGDGADAVRLPDSYNGLGFKNLIYMVVEILDVQEKWKADQENRAPLHLIFIEEPEAHLHAQLQQVFIRNVLSLLKVAGEDDGAFTSQIVVTTHSPHILYERGFGPIRYFRRDIIDGEQTTKVLNLSSFQKGDAPKDRDFLQRYLKLTHCDLFFADAAILVEGNVERLLLPLMIEKAAPTLRSSSLSILEVGGAFGHRFKEMIEFLGITTLIITDIDSVKVEPDPDQVIDESEDEEKEFEIPPEIEGGVPQKRYGATCLPGEEGAVTANQTLIQWLPKKRTINELHAVSSDEKEELLTGSGTAMVRIAYQVPTDVSFNGMTSKLCGRTLEEAFGLENTEWCQSPDQRSVGLKLRCAVTNPTALATGLHKRIIGKNFDKTKFALGVLTRNDSDWIVPLYIKEGLEWLREQVDLEVVQEIDVADGAMANVSMADIEVDKEVL